MIHVLGSSPTREQFTHTTISHYPLSVTRLISLLCMVLLLVAMTQIDWRLGVYREMQVLSDSLNRRKLNDQRTTQRSTFWATCRRRDATAAVLSQK